MTYKLSATFLFSVLSICCVSPAFGLEDSQLKELCNRYYENRYNSESERSRSSQSSDAFGMNGSFINGLGGGFGVNTQNASQSERYNRDVNSSQNVSEKDCTAVVSSYFMYKAQRDMAQLNKETALGVSSDNKEVGLSANKALRDVGISQSNADLYVGIGNAVGNMLGGLFNSGSQRAAAEKVYRAEVEKAKILAQAQVEMMRIQLEQARIQAGYGPSPAPIPNSYPPSTVPLQSPQAPTQSVENSSNMQQPRSPQDSQALPNPPFSIRQIEAIVPNSQPTVLTASVQQPNVSAQPTVVLASVQQPIASAQPAVVMASMQQPNTNASPQGAIAISQPLNPLRILGLAIAPSCSSTTLFIQTNSGQIYCAYPTASFRAGRYLFDGKRLIPN